MKSRVPVQEIPNGVAPMQSDLLRLTAKYFHKEFPAGDTSVRSVVVMNGTKFKLTKRPSPIGTAVPHPIYVLEKPADPQSVATAHLRGLAMVDKKWRDAKDEVDWDEVVGAAWCQDIPGQRLDELLLVMSNSEFRKDQHESVRPIALPPTMFTSNYGCGVWSGTVKLDWPPLGMTATWNLTFTPSQRNGTSKNFFIGDVLPVDGVGYNVSGSGTWNVNYESGGCKFSGSGTLDPEQLGTYLRTYNFVPDGPLHRRYDLQVHALTPLSVTATCNPGGTFQQAMPLPGLVLAHQVPSLYTTIPLVDPDGATMLQTFSVGSFQPEWTVNLRLQTAR